MNRRGLKTQLITLTLTAFYLISEVQCQDCPFDQPYFSETLKQCMDQCPRNTKVQGRNLCVCENDGYLIDQQTKDCLTYDQCTGFQDYVDFICYTKCPDNKYTYIVEKNMRKVLKTCNPYSKEKYLGQIKLYQQIGYEKLYKDSCKEGELMVDETSKCIKSEECQLISEDGKYCVPKCSSNQTYTLKLSDKQSMCQRTCKQNQIINEEMKQCYNDKNLCQMFLIDGRICQKTCPVNNFQYKYEETPYKKCDSRCEYISNENEEIKQCAKTREECSLFLIDDQICSKTCPINNFQYTNETTSYKMCNSRCEFISNENQEIKQCYRNKNECQMFLIDDRICSKTCPNNHYQFKNEKTPYKMCNSNCEFISTENGEKNICQLDCKKEDVYATVDGQDNLLQKYCNRCPNQSLFTKNIPQKFTACYSNCKESEISDYDLKKCLTSKEDCSNYLIDEKICAIDCKKDQFRYKNEKTSYKQCNTLCDQFPYSQDGQNMCDITCLQHHIIDKEAKRCYNKKTECQKFVSLNGKECNSKCGETEEYYVESNGNYKQCRLKVEQDINESKIDVSCSDKNSEIDKKKCNSKVNEEQNEDDQDDGLSGGAIAGIVIGVTAAIGTVAVGIVYFARVINNIKPKNKVQIVQNTQENVQTIDDNKVVVTLNTLEKIQTLN